MTASGRRLERLADLEEQRDFLLRSLDDLDRELEAGEVEDGEYETLRDDYTRRAAQLVRAIERDRDELPDRRPPGNRTWMVVAAVVVLAVVAGVAIAQSSGQRPPGGTFSGEVDASVRTRVAQAENLYFSGDVEGALEMVNEVLIDDRDLAEGLLLRSLIYEQQVQLVPALEDLQAVLEDDPENIEALTAQGRILVNVGDPETIERGIVSLDTAIALDPQTFEPFLWRGFTARVVEGDLLAATEYYRQALEREPPPQMAEIIRGRIAEMEAEIADS